MAESDFSWFKFASLFGAGFLIFLCFVTIAGGIHLIIDGHAFNGAATLIAGALCGVFAGLVWRNYDKKTRAAAPGVKIEDIKKK